MSRPAVTTFPVWGTTASVVSAEPGRLISALSEVERELDDIGRTCSRFRWDSDICRVNANAGSWIDVNALLVAAVEVALRAARVTDGLVDPTVGRAMHRIGYDRDFADVASSGPALSSAEPARGWRFVEISRADSRIRVPTACSLDLGATAKAFAADRAATRAAAVAGCGVLVSLGGDVATAGPPPPDGWTIGVADDHRTGPDESVSIAGGGLATSSVAVRRWSRGGVPVHHIVDPRTGEPAEEVWRTVSVAAASCVDANTASTAAIVMGEAAPSWLASRNLPARLVRAGEGIVRVGDWPDEIAA